jgi:hypothetical protein
MTLQGINFGTACKRLALLGAALASGVTAGPAFAATQGTFGATSTGNITITASVPNRAQLTNLADVNFTLVDPLVNASNAQNVCVWSNTTTKGYTIRATGDGASQAFTLASGALTVPYTVEWAATSGQTSGTSLVTNVASATLTTTAVSPTCSSAPLTTSSLIVRISSTNLLTMSAGTSYTGVLTLLVTPQ